MVRRGIVVLFLAAVLAGAGAAEGVLRGHTEIPNAAATRSRMPTAFGMFDARRGVMANLRGDLLTTVDGGRSWTATGHLRLRSIAVVSAVSAFGSGANGLFRTDDRGRHWRRLARVAGGLTFADARHGWIEGQPTLSTDDGGRTFRRLRVPCVRLGDYWALSRVSSRLGYAACGGGGGAGQQRKWLYVTRDAGRTWRLHGTLTWSGYLASISFSDAEHGLLTTGRGGLLATLDGGSSWRTVLVTDDVTDVVAAQWVAGRLVVLLLNGALLSSSDGGMTWRRLYPQTLPAPFETSFSGVEEGIGAGSSDWATGREVVVVTHDGGRTWHYRGALPDGMAIVRLFRVDADVVMATARVLGRSGTRLYRSLDDGRSWKRMRTPVASRYVAVSFATAHRGVLADDDGRFYRTSDGGRSWALLGSAGLDLRDFTLLTRTHGFAIAYDTLYETTDGARSWHFYNAPVERPLAIATHGSRHVWILGLPVCDERISRRQPNCPGTLATSDDGGDTWRRIRLNMIPGVIDVELVTPDTAYADGFVTRDRGLTWRLVRSR